MFGGFASTIIFSFVFTELNYNCHLQKLPSSVTTKILSSEAVLLKRQHLFGPFPGIIRLVLSSRAAGSNTISVVSKFSTFHNWNSVSLLATLYTNCVRKQTYYRRINCIRCFKVRKGQKQYKWLAMVFVKTVAHN